MELAERAPEHSDPMFNSSLLASSAFPEMAHTGSHMLQRFTNVRHLKVEHRQRSRYLDSIAYHIKLLCSGYLERKFEGNQPQGGLIQFALYRHAEQWTIPRQYRYERPPELTLTLPFSRADGHLSDPITYALTQTTLKFTVCCR